MFMLSFFSDFVTQADFVVPLIIASLVPLSIVALGALYSERTGVVNIALEGIMIMGAYVGAVVMKTLEPSELSTQWIIVIALAIGLITGAVFSLLHAFAAINMKANQIISATALNMFAPAFVIFINRTFSESHSSRVVLLRDDYRIPDVPFLSDIPFFGQLLFHNAYISTYIGAAIFIALTVFLYKTKWGLRMRSCGENPQAADSLGINIFKIRYAGVLVSGALAGLAGVIFAVSFAKEFDASVAGFGFLGIAVLIFGNWKPGRLLLAASFFAFMRVVSSISAVFPSLVALDIPKEIYQMLPYVATIVVLAFASKNSAAPKAAGEPYDPGKR